MASANGNDEYESDPEEAKLSLALRRRVASDDEEEEDEVEVTGGVDVRGCDDDDELDDHGVPEDYDDLEETDDEEGDEFRGDKVEIVREVLEGDVVVGDHVEGGDEEEVKKEQEPFAVPTTGVFYMHDDRYRDNAAGRQRRTLGPHKIWESRDERRWGHDKFEEMTSPDSNYSEARRNYKEHHRGRGRNRGSGRGYIKGNRSKIVEESSTQPPVPINVRGRGPRKYNPAYNRRSDVPQKQHNQSGKNLEKHARSFSDKGPESSLSVACEAVSAKKNSVASNLSSASPPFYPSGSSTNDLNVAPNMDMKSANSYRNPQPSSMYRGKIGDDSRGLNNLHLEEKAKKPLNSSNVHPSGFNSTFKGPQVRTRGRGQRYAEKMPYPSVSHFDDGKHASGKQINPSQHGPSVSDQIHSYSQGPTRPVSKHSGNGSQASSSPPAHASLVSVESAEEPQFECDKGKTAIVPKALSAVHGDALAPFVYNGGQIMGATGNMGIAHGDPNFPTFLPVMQFGAQHPGGIGVPAVGMAYPGYVQPQHGQGSSEMTWLPVLAGAAGGLGASYCPPYVLDGTTYNPQFTGPPFADSLSNNAANTNKATNELNPSQKLEHVNEEFDQHQNKSRRYSEMKFGR